MAFLVPTIPPDLARTCQVLIQFVPETTICREPELPQGLPILRNGPPGTFVLFPDGLRVSLPTDQIVSCDIHNGAACVGFGGMRFAGLEEGRLIFHRVRELLPEERLSPDRSHVMVLDPAWVSSVVVDGERVFPHNGRTGPTA
jgi:hypothetical protein